MMLIRAVKDRDMGIAIPWYLGQAWDEPSQRVTYLTYIPLNWVVAWGRQAWSRLMAGPRDRFTERLHEAYVTGHRDGVKEVRKRPPDVATYLDRVKVEPKR
jgi:hypothetical protein